MPVRLVTLSQFLQAHAGRNQEKAVEGRRRSVKFFLDAAFKPSFSSLATRRCMLIGVCLDEQIVNEVPREAHDATVDM